MQIPASIIQGDSVSWRDVPTRDNLGGIIDSTWTLTWVFAGPTTLTVTATASGAGWETALTAAQTAELVAAATREPNYVWQAKASKSGRVVTIGEGQLRVAPNLLGQQPGYDGRSPAEIALETVQKAIAARINGNLVAEYQIGTRRLRSEPMTELLKLEARYKQIVARECRARMLRNGLGDPLHTYVRF